MYYSIYFYGFFIIFYHNFQKMVISCVPYRFFCKNIINYVCTIITYQGGTIMKNNNPVKPSSIKKLLDRELTKDANSFCFFLYQPKEPKGLEKFKKNNN